MALPADYITGTITLTNGSVNFTGTDTGWLAADFREGDTIPYVAGGESFAPPIIATITSNTAGTLTTPWAGPTLIGVAYRMRYQWDSSRVSAQTRTMIEQLGNGNLQSISALTGPGVLVFDGPHSTVVRPETDFINGVAYNVQVDTLADRAAYNGQATGFAVLVSDVGDGRSAVYSKNSNTSGDWSDPAYVTGPVGPLPVLQVGDTTTLPPGSDATVSIVPVTGGYELDFGIPEGEGFNWAGVYNIANAYVQDDVVRHNGSAFIAIQAVPAGNSPSSVFPPVDTAYWAVLAAKGQDGTGTGDVVGPASSVAGNIAVFADTSGKLLADGGKIVFAPQGRLSLVSGVPIPTNDVAGATTIYYVPAVGNQVPVYDGVSFVQRTIVTQLSNPLSATYHPSETALDEWIFMDGTTLRIGTGPSWGAGVPVVGDRGTGAGSTEIELFNGIYVNRNSMMIRWGTGAGETVTVPARQATLAGSFATSAAGQASDTIYRRLLSNAYNQTERLISENPDNTPNWQYSTAAFRPSNNNGATIADYFQTLSGTVLKVTTKTKVISSGVTAVVAGMAIRFDGSDVIQEFISVSNARVELIYLFMNRQAGLGYHNVGLSERGAGSDIQTWFGGGGRLTGTVLN